MKVLKTFRTGRQLHRVKGESDEWQLKFSDVPAFDDEEMCAKIRKFQIENNINSKLGWKIVDSIYSVDGIDEDHQKQLDEIIASYNFQPFDTWEQMCYYILGMFVSQDNHKGTVHGRKIWREGFISLMEGEDIEKVCHLIDGKSYNEAVAILGRHPKYGCGQKSLFDY